MSFFYLLARASMGLGWLRTQQHLCRRKSRNFSLGWREVQILVQKGLLNFLGANYLSPHPLPLVTEKAETTTCFSICESQLPLAREIHRLLRVPKDNHIFEYSWNIVWWQNTTRVSLKNPGGGGGPGPLDHPLGYTTSLVPFDILSTAFSNSNTPIANYRCTF